MLKIDRVTLDQLESKYPGIREQILRFEEATLPACPRCGSDDTAVAPEVLGQSTTSFIQREVEGITLHLEEEHYSFL